MLVVHPNLEKAGDTAGLFGELGYQPYTAATGRDAFRTATGVHAAAVIKAFKTNDPVLADVVYSAVPAKMIGREQIIEAITILTERAIASGQIRSDARPMDLIRAIAGFTITYGDDTQGWQESALRLVDILMDGLRAPILPSKH